MNGQHPHPVETSYFGPFPGVGNRPPSASRPSFTNTIGHSGANRMAQRQHLEPINQASPLLISEQFDRLSTNTVNNDFRSRFHYDGHPGNGNGNGFNFSNTQAWHHNSGANTLGTALGDGSRIRAGAPRARLPTEWYAEPPTNQSVYPPSAPFANAGPYNPQMMMMNGGGVLTNDRHGFPSPYDAMAVRQPTPKMPGQTESLIPTAIVIKNIPFNVRKEHLASIMSDLGLPNPYAFNYHFDSGVFRGLAFANFSNPEDTYTVIETLNGFEVMGRKLRVEYKKMLPEAERERIEREKREKRGQLEEQHQPMALQHQASIHSLSSVAKQESPIRDLDMNNPETLKFFTELTIFKSDPERETLFYPSSLTSNQRRTIHTLAHHMGLHHCSVGEGNNRQIQVMKSSAISAAQSIASPGVSLDMHRRGLSRAATIDQIAETFANSRHRGPHLTIPDSPDAQLSQNALRGVKSFADLRSYSPSPSMSNSGFMGGGHGQGNGLTHYGDYGLQGQSSTLTTPTTPGTAAAGGADPNLLIPGLGAMSLGDNLLSQMRQRDSQGPGAIGSQRPGLNGAANRSVPDRQPLGPTSDSRGDFGAWRNPSRGHRPQNSDSSENGVRVTNGSRYQQ